LLLVPASSLAADEFRSGVTAGEVTNQSAIVWARTNRQAYVKAQVATDNLFQNVVAERTLLASDDNDHTVQTKFGGLSADTRYHYRFCFSDGSPCSNRGTFKTAPSPDADKTIKFAYSGDETAVAAPDDTHPFWGNSKAFASMVAEHNNFNIDLGDVIYSDPEVPGVAPVTGLGGKWAMYRSKLGLLNMQRLRQASGLYNHWDDHEFINDFSPNENTFTASNGQTIKIDPRKLYNRSVRAFRDYEPVTFSQDRGIYRSFRWGQNLQVFFLDERSFRSPKASAGHTCDNPDTGKPDLAPTAPKNTRTFFANLAPSLSQPVSQACKDKINNSTRTFLGKDQLDRFVYQVAHSTARWKVVMNETPIQQFYALPYDRWEGYAYERVQLLKRLRNANVKHVVFLTTDTHGALANVVRYRTLSGDVAPSNVPSGTPPIDSPYQDFVIGPVATKTFWQEIDDETGTSGSGQAISNAFFKPAATGSSPPGGMGMACAQGGENSYAEVTASSTSLTIEYKDENGNVLLDSDGTTPCGPYVLPF
jgi:phosphodiesterase/alkaline phosphatase D-like protein